MKPIRTHLTVLVADDDVASREAIISILVRKYPQLLIYSAGDGKTALEAFDKYLPDIIITDVIMPEMDGISLAREIRARDAAAKLIILTGLSALTDFRDVQRTEITFDHTVFKPVDLGKLFAAIDQCIDEIVGNIPSI